MPKRDNKNKSGGKQLKQIKRSRKKFVLHPATGRAKNSNVNNFSHAYLVPYKPQPPNNNKHNCRVTCRQQKKRRKIFI